MASSVSALKAVSEPTRQRETYKYDPSLLTSIKYNDGGLPIPSSELTTSEDTVLTALCQLGAWRLNTARSMISLFDKNYQYIVAEATPTLPLLPGLNHEERNEDLWLCGTAIPRQHGVCEYTLCADDPADFEGGNDLTKLPLALVPDLTADPRFSDKPYCRPGTPARFYAAVPIRTHRGINIGVYCVIHTEPRPVSDWDAASTEVMRSISRTIMDHLEDRRSSYIHKRSAGMNRGLGSFVEGRTTLAGSRRDVASSEHDGATRLDSAAKDPAQPVLLTEKGLPARAASVDKFDGMNGGPAQPAPDERQETAGTKVTATFASTPRTQSPPPMNPAQRPTKLSSEGNTVTGHNPVHDIFARASTIIRESIQADGFLFLDASIGSFGSGVLDTPSIGKDDVVDGQSSSTTNEEGSKSDPLDDVPELLSRVLGFSAAARSDGFTRGLSHHAAVPQKFLSRLLRRYPRGKIFNFDQDGQLQSSDSSGDSRTSPTSKPPRMRAVASDDEAGDSRRPPSPWSRRNEGVTIRHTFPKARSVAFVPVWDAKRERWFAGGFAYTYTTTRIFTIEGELSYLRAFGMLTMEESFRLQTQLADKAKSDVLNSLSHELRSPLHGIVLGIELLGDTKMDLFQENIMHTLETCSRTLLDTVDHLLDFSKINNYLARIKKRHAVGDRGLRQGRGKAIEAGMKSLHSHVKIDSLTEEVMESVFAGFNFQHMSLSQLAKKATAKGVDIHAHRRLETMRAMEELGPDLTETGELRFNFGKVSIFLDVDPSRSWTFHTQAGAVRRVVMNLFGNALKYTKEGTVTVSLKQETAKRRGKLRMVNIIVADTGKGISEDYLQHDLFRPFSQEDHLAPGTGLGLSLVKQIVSQLKGSITVQSRVGVGTTVSVSLPMLPVVRSLEAAITTTEQDADFLQELSELQGRSVSLIGFRGSPTSKDVTPPADPRLNDHSLVETMCRGWLQLKVVPEPQAAEQAPDVVICTEPLLSELPSLKGYSALPTVVVCPNALVAYRCTTSPDFTEKDGIYEFISQPTGARKIAKAISDVLKRQRDQPKHLSPVEKTEQESHVVPLAVKWTPSLVAAEPSVQEESERISNSTITRATVNLDTQASLLVADTDEPTPEQPMEFLLVDDNHINLKILSTYSKKIGRRYATATNGFEAVEAFCRSPGRYKCVFMDISMPVMDGFEATRRIRAFEREKSLAPASIFALSGLASSGAQREAFESGIDLFLTKPVKLKELGTILEARGLI